MYADQAPWLHVVVALFPVWPAGQERVHTVPSARLPLPSAELVHDQLGPETADAGHGCVWVWVGGWCGCAAKQVD